MPKYPDTMITSKTGVNFVKTVVDSAGCIFHRIDQENDLGIDAIVEIIKNGRPLCNQIGVQIKSGQAFHNSQKNQCLIPVGSHYNYWLQYPLAVYGIVYVPTLNSANWVDIKWYLKQSGTCSTIKFDRTKTNVFDKENFLKFFIPDVLKELPQLSFDEAVTFFHSIHIAESHLGLISLFRIAPNSIDVWDWFIDHFKKKDRSEIPPILVYYFAHIPWHGDIIYRGKGFSSEIKAHVKNRFSEFNKQDVTKLLNFIDRENGISRGSLGQSVEAIISSLPERDNLLLEIIMDTQLDIHIREFAVLIYAYHHQKDALPLLKSLSDQESWYAGEIFSFICENGWVDPYG